MMSRNVGSSQGNAQKYRKSIKNFVEFRRKLVRIAAAWRLGRWEIVRPRRHRALLCGPSTSSLERMGCGSGSGRVNVESY
jgi:hypothetical protein